ncbi:plasmid mobilization protein [Schaalia sp. JY-X169]|uniref:plasmid mobilization protein n=1 Tax=Schaalia sp. JY-X169 TaxID=2758572 RepID=UPI001C713B85|nr:hypothetical protein [Schaalia sp. JY-X169]
MTRFDPFAEDRNNGPHSPPPASNNVAEDGGQRYLEDSRHSEMSDKYPAGLTTNPGRDTKQSVVSEARGVSSRGSTGPAVPGAEVTPERRATSLDIRLTVSERKEIQSRARVLGVRPSTWARAVIFDALDSRRSLESKLIQVALAAPNPEQARAIAQLRRVGVNLNQTLRKGNTVDEALLHEVLAAVDQLRDSFGDRTRI